MTLHAATIDLANTFHIPLTSPPQHNMPHPQNASPKKCVPRPVALDFVSYISPTAVRDLLTRGLLVGEGGSAVGPRPSAERGEGRERR
jgi:hypothetical protein